MWVFPSLIVLLAESFKNLSLKFSSESFDSMIIAWSWRVYSLIILLPIFIYSLTLGITVKPEFWVAVPFILIIFTIAPYLYSLSTKHTDLSNSLPMLALSPLVLLISSFFLNGEVPTFKALIGILTIISGIYWLNLKSKQNLLQPFKNIWTNLGVRYMFFVSILWGFGTTLDKFAITNSNALFYVGIMPILYLAIVTPFLLYKHPKKIKHAMSVKNIRVLGISGFLDGVTSLFQMIAVSMTVSSYVIAIKRGTIVLSAILESIYFKKEIKSKLPKIILVVVGLLIVIL